MTTSTCPIVYGEGLEGTPPFAHIILHDPASVLRSIAADRRMLERHARCAFPANADPWCEWCSNEDETGIGPEPWPCRDLLDRLSVFATHPDYNPKWTP